MDTKGMQVLCVLVFPQQVWYTGSQHSLALC